MPDEDATNASPPVLAYARPHAAPDEQPPDSRLVLERDAGGLTLTDPPNRRAFVENLRFGLLLLTVGPAWLVGLWADATGGEWHVRDVISPLAVACVGAAIAAEAWASGKRPTQIAVRGGALVYTVPTLFGRPQRWPVDKAWDLCVGRPMTNLWTGRVKCSLQVRPRWGRFVTILTNRPVEEVQWAAAVLRAALAEQGKA